MHDWGLNSPDLWHSPCPSQPSIGQPPYRRALRPRDRRRWRGRWARWRLARRRYSTGRNAPYAGPSWSRSARGKITSYVFIDVLGGVTLCQRIPSSLTMLYLMPFSLIFSTFCFHENRCLNYTAGVSKMKSPKRVINIASLKDLIKSWPNNSQLS